MVLGTSSGAGKSLMTRPLPGAAPPRRTAAALRGQNMSNNAWVDADGGEMAYSQAMQAWPPDWNPAVP